MSNPGEIPQQDVYTFSNAEAEDIRVEQGALGQRWPGAQGPLGAAPVAPGKDVSNTLKPRGYLRIIWFGKVHYIHPKLFERDAWMYREYQRKEVILLMQQVRSCRDVYEEWAHPREFIQAGVANVVYFWDILATNFKGTIHEMAPKWFAEIEKVPRPDIKEYGKLLDRLYEIDSKLAENKLEAPHLAEQGLALALVRTDHQRLEKAVSNFRERAIERADQTTQGLISVESLSFQILNVVPTLTMMDPIREAAYKLAVLAVRAAARGGGGALAWGGLGGFKREAWAVIRTEGPNTIADIMMVFIKRLGIIQGLGQGFFKRELVVHIIQQCIDGAAEVFRAFDENAGKPLSDEQWDAILTNRIAQFAEHIIGSVLPTGLADTALKTWAKAIATSASGALIRDYRNAEQTSKKTGEPVGEVLWNDAPTIIMRLVQSVLVGFFNRQGQRMTEYARTQGVSETRSFKEAWDVASNTTVSWNSDSTIRLAPTSGAHSYEASKFEVAIDNIRSGRLKPLTTDFYNKEGWPDTNLEPAVAAGVRRYCDHFKRYILAHKPKNTRLRHATGEARGAKEPKVMEVHAKTSDNPKYKDQDKLGLVLKPTTDPNRKPGDGPGPEDTHKNYDAAIKGWNKYASEMRSKGVIVLENGVVTHPTQIKRWVKMKTAGLSPTEQETVLKVMNQLSKSTAWDLTDASSRKGVDNLIAHGVITEAEYNTFVRVMNAAKVGYYADFDIADMVDGNSGRAIWFGNDKDEGQDLALANRRAANKLWMEDWKGETREDNSQGKPMTEIPGAEMGHGVSESLRKKAEAGRPIWADRTIVPVAEGLGIGPGGQVRSFKYEPTPDDIAAAMKDKNGRALEPYGPEFNDNLSQIVHAKIVKQFEGWVKLQLAKNGVEYLDPSQRYGQVQTEIKVAAKRQRPSRAQGVEVTARQLEAVINMHMPVVVIDEPGLVDSPKELDVLNSLRHRGLKVAPHDVARTFKPGLSPYDVERWWRDGIFAGVSPKGLVIAAIHDNRRLLADTLEKMLAACRQCNGFNPDEHDGVAQDAGYRVHWELYSAYKPVTRDFIVNCFGPDENGLPLPPAKGKDPYANIRADLTSAKPPKGREHWAYSLINWVHSFSPDKGAYGPVLGMRLMDVWEDPKTDKLIYTPTKLLGFTVAVFYEGLVASPTEVTPYLTAKKALAEKKKG